jgi:hypothetical protein
MNILEANICIGLGDIIHIKGQLEPFKHRFEQIKITFDQKIINDFRPDKEYRCFLDEIGHLFFSSPPYKLNVGSFVRKGQNQICEEYGLPFIRPNLKNILCQGYLLQTDREYIVLTTKHRFFTQSYWRTVCGRFWQIINKLSERYKIVILGERQVEKSKEYRIFGEEVVYSIYNDIMANIPQNKIIDMTVPSLGITAPNLQRIRQDCLIMSEARAVVILGTGGAFCMATAVANLIGHRTDIDLLYENVIYPDAFVSRSFDQFVERLEMLL